MPFERITVGDVEVTALLDLEMLESPMVEAFPDVPPEAILAERGRYPGVFGPHDEWLLRVRAWLVEHPDGRLLMDTGVGGRASPAMEWTSGPGAVRDALDEASASVDDIDTVILSHVHDDHIGGTVDDAGDPTFPNARYVIQRADLEWQRGLAIADETAASHGQVWERLLRPLERSDVLHVIEGDVELTSRLAIAHAPGHTPGHQVVWVRGDTSRLLLCADAFNHPAQLDHPEWPSGPDADHHRAEHTRRLLLEDLRTSPDTTIAPTHFDHAFGRVVLDAEAPWRPINTAHGP